MNLEERSLVGAFYSIFGATVVGLVISVIFTPLLVRLLGAEAFGNYAFVLSIISLLMIFANSGVTRGVRKYLPESRRPETWRSEVFGFYVRVSLLLVVLVCSPVLLLWSVDFFGMVDPRLVRYVPLLVLVVFVKQLYWLVLNVLRGLGYERYSEPIKVFQEGSFAGVALGLAYVGFGVAGVLVGYAVSFALAVLAAGAFIVGLLDVRTIGRGHPDLPRRELLTFNTQSVVLVFLMVSLYNFDVILLRLLTTDAQTGYYKAALVVAQLMWLVPKALETLLLHSAANYWSEDRREKIEAVSSVATRYTLLTSALMAGGLFVLADDFIPVYFGAPFSAAVPPMLLLLPGVIGFAMARPMSAIGQGSGELRVLIYATAGAATLNVVLNLLLIPTLGMEGAAIATSIGYGSLAVLYTFASRRIGFDPVGDVRALRIGSAALLVTLLMAAVDVAVGSRYLSLVVVPVVGTTVYLALLLRTGVVTEREVRSITKDLPGPVAAGTNRVVSALTSSGP